MAPSTEEFEFSLSVQVLKFNFCVLTCSFTLFFQMRKRFLFLDECNGNVLFAMSYKVLLIAIFVTLGTQSKMV